MLVLFGMRRAARRGTGNMREDMMDPQKPRPQAGTQRAAPKQARKGAVIRSAVMGGVLVLGLGAFLYLRVYRESVTYHIRCLRSDSIEARIRAIATLSGMGTGAKAAIPALIEAAQDPYMPLHQEASHLLRTIAKGDKEAIELLIKALDGGDEKSRQKVAAVLLQLGPEAVSAIPAFRELLKAEDFGDRKTALYALQELGSDVRVVVDDIFAGFADKDPTFRNEAAIVMGRIAVGNKKLVPRIVKDLDSSDVHRRMTAIRALLEIGNRDARVAPSLLHAARDKSADVRGAAASSLLTLASSGDAVINAIRKALPSLDTATRNRLDQGVKNILEERRRRREQEKKSRRR